MEFLWANDPRRKSLKEGAGAVGEVVAVVAAEHPRLRPINSGLDISLDVLEWSCLLHISSGLGKT